MPLTFPGAAGPKSPQSSTQNTTSQPGGIRPTGIGLCESANGPRCYYAIGAMVGSGGLNQRTDVLLVQYFLREIFARDKFFKESPYPGGVLVVDGWIGPKTCGAILHFQSVLAKNGRSIATDGKVHSAHDISIFTTTPTIYWLNVYYKEARPADWPKVSRAIDCPVELRAILTEPSAPPFC